ncbi:SIMPL domain-containing protein [uncultured Sphingomonas sp.]|uniref:SIMPL domain-containing protein n=1 Tax=uncultured Sphingomonas sp. TaxID=158754 RepID=UPI0035CA89BC
MNRAELKTVALTAAMFASGVAGAQGSPQSPQPTVEALVPASGAVLDVVAEGRTMRVPDLATIRAGVMTTGPTAAAAMRDNADRMARVLAGLRRAEVAARDVQTAQVNLQPQYRYAENQPPVVTGYQATDIVAVRFWEIGRAGGLLDALVSEGANQIDGPSLSLDRPDAALDEARTDAVRRARARAELYARAAGLRVERIVAIAEGGAPIGGPPPVMFAAAARQMRAQGESRTALAAGESEVTATVTVRFLLR